MASAQTEVLAALDSAMWALSDACVALEVEVRNASAQHAVMTLQQAETLFVGMAGLQQRTIDRLRAMAFAQAPRA